jgi:FkbM family methyltransferase
VTSQESRILSHFNGYAGTALDVGANDGIFLSNTLTLEREYGWDVLCIEANPLYGPDLWANRKRSVIGAVGTNHPEPHLHIYTSRYGYASNTSLQRNGNDPPAHIIPTIVHPLNWYLERSGFAQLDVLCMDIEGTEDDALDGLDFTRWGPKILCIENWSGDNHFKERLAPFGYQCIGGKDFDQIFLRSA